MGPRSKTFQHSYVLLEHTRSSMIVTLSHRHKDHDASCCVNGYGPETPWGPACSLAAAETASLGATDNSTNGVSNLARHGGAN